MKMISVVIYHLQLLEASPKLALI